MSFDYDSVEQRLRVAAGKGDNTLVKELLASGANMNAVPDASASTAFELALKSGHVDTAHILFEAGAVLADGWDQLLEELTLLNQRVSETDDSTVEAMKRKTLGLYARGLLSRHEVEAKLGLRPYGPRTGCITPGS